MTVSVPDPTAFFPAFPTAVLVQLTALLHSVHLEPCRVDPLVSDPRWRSPAAFRVASSDGRTLKVRVGESARLVARYAQLAAELADPGIPVPLGRVGRVTAEAWVEGVILTPAAVGDRHLDAAGALLRRVHAFAGRSGSRLPQRRSTRLLQARTLAQIDDLLAVGLLDVEAAARVQRLVGRLPEVAPWGLVHLDVCPQNLVERRDGSLVCIDNERLGRGFLDVDLARTWYRWPMSQAMWHRLEASYRSGQAEADPDEQRAWRGVAVVRAVHMRHRRGASTADGLDGLDRLTRGEGSAER